MPTELDSMMLLATAEAERARGTTGDNPWVGCVIVSDAGELLARGHTQGPGEDHSEIAALREARRQGRDVTGATMFSTLEPCAFHGRTPACARVIVTSGVARVVVGMRDPHPRVDGEGVRILRAAGLQVIEGVAEREVRRQLGTWVLAYHPHDLVRRAAAYRTEQSEVDVIARLAAAYAVDEAAVRSLLDEARSRHPT